MNTKSDRTHATLPGRLKKAIHRFVERCPLWIFATLYIFVLLLASWLLWETGTLVLAATNARVDSYWTALYFSAITITTVGYGDVIPVRWGRAVACAEALLGLVLMGLMLARVTSWRLSNYVSMLVETDVIRRLQRTKQGFEDIEGYALQLLGFSREALSVNSSSEQVDEFQGRLEDLVSLLEATAHDCTARFAREMAGGMPADDMSPDLLLPLAIAIEEATLRIHYVLETVPMERRALVIHHGIRRKLEAAASKCKQFCHKVLEESRDEKLRAAFTAAENASRGMSSPLDVTSPN